MALSCTGKEYEMILSEIAKTIKVQKKPEGEGVITQNLKATQLISEIVCYVSTPRTTDDIKSDIIDFLKQKFKDTQEKQTDSVLAEYFISENNLNVYVKHHPSRGKYIRIDYHESYFMELNQIACIIYKLGENLKIKNERKGEKIQNLLKENEFAEYNPYHFEQNQSRLEICKHMASCRNQIVLANKIAYEIIKSGLIIGKFKVHSTYQQDAFKPDLLYDATLEMEDIFSGGEVNLEKYSFSEEYKLMPTDFYT